jgi:hypothetical protein
MTMFAANTSWTSTTAQALYGTALTSALIGVLACVSIYALAPGGRSLRSIFQ